MSTKVERETVVRSGSPLRHHSFNQQRLRQVWEDELSSLKPNKDFERLVSKASELEEENQPIPQRIGVLALTIASIINKELKNRGEESVDEVKELPRFEFTTNPPFQKLIPIDKMVDKYLIESRQVLTDPKIRKQACEAANLFAENFGGLIFSEGPELTAVSGLIAAKNIAKYLAEEIDENRLDIFAARKMLVYFGLTVNQELVRN